MQSGLEEFMVLQRHGCAGEGAGKETWYLKMRLGRGQREGYKCLSGICTRQDEPDRVNQLFGGVSPSRSPRTSTHIGEVESEMLLSRGAVQLGLQQTQLENTYKCIWVCGDCTGRSGIYGQVRGHRESQLAQLTQMGSIGGSCFQELSPREENN